VRELETAATMPLLQDAFERAWKGAARDGELRRLFKSTYDAALKKFSQGVTANA
jgi:hypothetical protein